jgi:hypothetical protein
VLLLAGADKQGLAILLLLADATGAFEDIY